ncbi:Outer membrane receptor proteins, mostly Fe transport [Algoriella xinjiangensis]|uniref:Outer membrane receptor proteins, mostly Fe transport n=1 Tax=Algoriella xinjiangensis TaxID=684065 RepID=A0A1I5AQ64_9FLAO|nr:outer membrane beta-barrel family protein [Algoriella xinjiangensis]SFN64573.1 Outer membrane receptor proteins, mostly Fe transport [Algoriella xinjiangensis]VDH17025.1 Iron-regulated outer membrane proteins [Algoriella xinjiangensis]
MKLNKITLAILFSVCSIYGFAQEHHPVKGKIENAKNEAVGMAAIQIYKADSKELFDEIYANENGTFEILDLEDGKYRLVITEFGYKQSETVAEVKGGELDLGNIVLEVAPTDVVELKGAFVRAEVSQYRNEIDKRVVEIGNDLVSAGADAAAVLNNIPSVNVDQQTGELSLRGNENVKIYIDGKPSSLSASQVLKQIPSNQIKSVEIITNPSAKYEADGKSGIINIVMVKGQKKGYNIALSTGYEQGKRSRFNNSLTANVNTGSFNIFGTYSYNKRPNEFHGGLDNYNTNLWSGIDILNKNENQSAKLGFDWFIDDKTALTLYTNQWFGKGSGSINSDVRDNNTNILYPNSSEFSGDWKSQDYSLNLKREFDHADHNLVLDVFFSKSKDPDDRDMLNFYPKKEKYYEDRLPITDNTRVNLDYTNQIKDGGKIEAGLQFRRENSDSDMLTDRRITVEGQLYDPSTDFNFTRDFFSAYVNYGQKFGKFGMQLGLRAEQFKDSGDYTVNVTVKRKLDNEKLDFFPSAFLTYDVTEKGQVSLNYSRRIDRPGINQLSPVPEWSTPLMSSVGNPNLKPEYTDNYEVGYLQRFDKNSISANVFYRQIKDNIFRNVLRNEEVIGAYIQNYENYDKVNAYGFELSFNLVPTKWWSTNISGDYTHNTMVVQQETELIEMDANRLTARMNNTFKLTKVISLQHFFMYQGKYRFIQGEMQDMWRMDLGARYTFMGGKASLSARVSDIFRTFYGRLEMYTPDRGSGKFRWEAQTMNIGFTYNFGGKVRNRADAQQNKTESNGGGVGF